MSKSRLLGASALFGTLLIAAPVFAQEPIPPADSAQAADQEAASDNQEVVVTGSRIQRPESSGVLPGVQVTQEQIQTRGFTNALDIVNDIPLVGSGASLSGTNGLGQPTALGQGFLDLLDLGTTRTLTLINGRRMVGANTATLFAFGNETGSQVDVNTIPTQLVDRVDVVTVGGAAAYGTDAIAGVVNFILRDNYKGVDLTAISNINERGDGFGYNLRALAGTNFDGGRGNVVVNFEYSRIDSIYGGRSFIDNQPTFVPGFGNGGVRNTAYTPTLNGTGTVFLPVATDGATGNLGLPFSRSLTNSFGGSIFEVLGTFPAQNRVAANPGAQTFISSVSQFVPGTVVSAAQAGCATTNTRFCNFAPSALPGAGAAQDAFAQSVLASLSPANLAAGTQAQRNTLALQLLQANRPTPREFFAANPSVTTGAFIGQFVPGFIDVANPDTRLVTIAGQSVPLNQILPRIGVPLRFTAGGNVIALDPGALTPTTPATIAANTSPDGFYDPRGSGGVPGQILRPQQERYIANLIGKYDFTDNITFFTENVYARTKAVLPRTTATANSVTGTAFETAALIVNVNNPYLDDADRTAPPR